VPNSDSCAEAKRNAAGNGIPPNLLHILVEPVRNYLSDSRAILFQHHHMSIAVLCPSAPAVRGTVRELRRGRPGPPLQASPKSWRREYRAPKASIQNLLQARKGTKGALHYPEIDEKAKQAWARRHEQHCLAAIERLDH